MAVQIPTIVQLYGEILSDLENELSINIPIFGKIFLRAIAAVQAGKMKLIYLAIALVQKNIFPDLADPESNGGTLERFGRVKLGRSRYSAQAGTYAVEVNGTNGAVIPAQTTFKSDDDSLNPGLLYILDAEHIMGGAVDTIALRALTPGLDAQLIVGDTLSSTAPIANVDSVGTVTAETITPLSEESISEYRARIVEAFQLEPQGGAASDYRIWSADAQGVKTVYPYAKSGSPNEVAVYVEATAADSTDGKGTPGASVLADVVEVINFDPDTSRPLNERGRRPVNVVVDVQAITALAVDIEIINYVDLNTTIQNTINEALATSIGRIRPFVGAADILANKNDILGNFNISYFIQQAVPGSRFDGVKLYVGGIEVSAYQFLDGNIPYLNFVYYV